MSLRHCSSSAAVARYYECVADHHIDLATAVYVDKILRGAHPGELPIEQPTQFSLAVNLRAAKALGLNLPQSILLRADETIR